LLLEKVAGGKRRLGTQEEDVQKARIDQVAPEASDQSWTGDNTRIQQLCRTDPIRRATSASDGSGWQPRPEDQDRLNLSD
jgi:hypothetical protein